jgi:hypothetical protein
MKDAFTMGVAKANALKDGDVLIGAYREAIAAGYLQETPAYAAFVEGYLNALEQRFPSGIFTDAAGRAKNH